MYVMNRTPMTMQIEVPFEGFSSVYTIPPNVLVKAPEELLAAIRSRLPKNANIAFIEDPVAIRVDALTKRMNISNAKAYDQVMAQDQVPQVVTVPIKEEPPKKDVKRKKKE